MLWRDERSVRYSVVSVVISHSMDSMQYIPDSYDFEDWAPLMYFNKVLAQRSISLKSCFRSLTLNISV